MQLCNRDAVADHVDAANGIDAEEFFRELPEDSFTPDEESLREALLTLLATSKIPCSRVEIDPDVQEFFARVVPMECLVSLRDYVGRRLGGEIEVGEDSSGEVFMGLIGELQIPQKRARLV